MRLPVSRDRYEEMKARAEWAEGRLREAELKAATAGFAEEAASARLKETQQQLADQQAESRRLSQTLGEFIEILRAAGPGHVEELGAEAARTEPATTAAPERERVHVLSPLEVVSRATEHRNLRRAGFPVRPGNK